MVHESLNIGSVLICKWSRHGRSCDGGPGTVVVKWEAEEPATGGLEETLAQYDCEVWIYGAPQPDGHADLEEMRRKLG
jgi:hypothetical protein